MELLRLLLLLLLLQEEQEGLMARMLRVYQLDEDYQALALAWALDRQLQLLLQQATMG